MIKNVRASVFFVAIVLTLLPAIATYYALQGTLASSVAIGLSPSVSEELERAGDRLKDLARLKPGESERYRAEFERLQEVRTSYSSLFGLLHSIGHSTLQAVAIVVAASLVFALLVASWLNSRVIRSHSRAIEEMKRAQRRVDHFENRESWNLTAQKLVHEVKNPLTPIQVMTGRLLNRYEALREDPARFRSILRDTEEIVREETGKISEWINAFARFARMPEPRAVPTDLNALVVRFVERNRESWENAELVFGDSTSQVERIVKLDPVLTQQVLFNLAKNAAEATSPTQVRISFSVHAGLKGSTVLSVADDGPGIPDTFRASLFRPYQTSRASEGGSGLGLAISRKIMLEQSGDLTYCASEKGARFEMVFHEES